MICPGERWIVGNLAFMDKDGKSWGMNGLFCFHKFWKINVAANDPIEKPVEFWIVSLQNGGITTLLYDNQEGWLNEKISCKRLMRNVLWQNIAIFVEIGANADNYLPFIGEPGMRQKIAVTIS